MRRIWSDLIIPALVIVNGIAWFAAHDPWLLAIAGLWALYGIHDRLGDIRDTPTKTFVINDGETMQRLRDEAE